ncbi:fimbrial protein [Corticibacter populi]|uniref:Fimbrial protein n=1 Tax=Corticibacter populi TaxID=1550736 RepID=A0A3M6QUG3_9BURK|nr:PilN domain-containing protein [Corticibacter populi]RMX06675.1 fimbrial protein [Corticibacter populi]RZS31748.1 type IV pilus assembly protein PilN [Corticibacter populi]
MIRINLLPHREAAKKARKESFIASSVLAGLVGLLVAGGIYLFFQALIADQNSANDMIRQENARLKNQIREVADIESEIAALKARQDAVENLQAERNLPVQLLNHVSSDVPNGSFVVSLKQSDKSVALQGMAQSNQTVSDLLSNLTDEMPWNTNPQLIESKATNVDLGNKQQRRVYGYSLNFKLDKPATDESQGHAQAGTATRRQ